MNFFEARIKKVSDHTGDNDGEQSLPVELIGEPEEVHADLLKKGKGS
jgi:hypothetical protein